MGLTGQAYRLLGLERPRDGENCGGHILQVNLWGTYSGRPSAEAATATEYTWDPFSPYRLQVRALPQQLPVRCAWWPFGTACRGQVILVFWLRVL